MARATLAVEEPTRHLEAAAQWLLRAQDMASGGGVSYGYSLRGGWRGAYPETSGYIAVTFLDIAKELGWPGYATRARAILEWLAGIQNEDGSFGNPRYLNGRGLVFDTGQVLQGLVRGYQESGDPRILAAARRAAGWLVSVVDGEGLWTRSTFNGIPHVYNARTAWALLEFSAEDCRSRRGQEDVARANLDWALSQEAGAAFHRCAFREKEAPFTHTIAYALRGLTESGCLLGETRYLEGALRVSRSLLGHLRSDGFIPGRIGVDGTARGRYSCLTGNCQLALVFARLASMYEACDLRDAAVRALRYVMRTQDTRCGNLDIRGGIKGSMPIWGGYAPFTYPNWAAKFFVDACLLCSGWLE